MKNVLTFEQQIYSAIFPCTTHLDFSIGTALWFASQGNGYLRLEQKEIGLVRDKEEKNSGRQLDVKPKSPPREASATGEGLLALPVFKHNQVKASKLMAMLLGQADSAAQNLPTKGDSQNKPAQTKCELALSRCSGGAKRNCKNGACGQCCKRAQRDGSAGPCQTHSLNKKRRIETQLLQEQPSAPESHAEQIPYCSSATILLSGLGADELMGGYGRHRVRFKVAGWEALEEEMHRDLERLWKRNLGRDDRCIADHGKEARYPFLDEEVVRLVSSLPLKDVVDPLMPRGLGDKRILRVVCALLGLYDTATREKRAIQFGTRIAQLTRAEARGSNTSFNANSPYELVTGTTSLNQTGANMS